MNVCRVVENVFKAYDCGVHIPCVKCDGLDGEMMIFFFAIYRMLYICV